jgi:hypothetical protein
MLQSSKSEIAVIEIAAEEFRRIFGFGGEPRELGHGMSFAPIIKVYTEVTLSPRSSEGGHGVNQTATSAKG